MPPRRSPPRHRHDGTSPLPLGMDWSPPPKRWTGRDTVWPHDPQTGWSYCVTIPSWIAQPDLGISDDSLINPIVFYRVQVGIQSPDGTSSARGILRRFSDFLKLFSALKKSFPKKSIPPAPPKHALLRINSSRLLLEERRYALEEWMEKLLSDIDLSRSVHVASFLELEVAARSSFRDASTSNFESNPSDSTGLSTKLRVRTGSSTSIGNSIASAGHSLASDCSSDNACEVSEAESPRHEMAHKYEANTEGSSVVRNDIRDDLPREINSSHPEAFSKPVVKTENASKEAVFFVNRIGDANEIQHDRLSSHTRKNSNESITSDISSIRGSELQNAGLSDSLGDSFVDFLEGEVSATLEAMTRTDPLSANDMRVIFPLDQRQKLNRILLTMQRRLVTAKTDMEDLIARLHQEIAVKEYLSTKVKDLEGELESSRQKSKENMQQAILVERERITQMQWDMDELRRKTLEMESRLYSEQNERVSAESEKAAAFSEREILVQDLGAKKEQVTNLQRRLEEVEMKSKSDIKVLVKEVKSLRKSQVELTEKLNKSIKEKTELERALQKEKEKWEDAKLAKKNLLHECGVLRGRLEDCNVNVFLEEEDDLTVNPSALPDSLDLLATSDNRIGLLLAEAQLLARDNGADVSSLGDASSKELSRNSSAMNGEDLRTSDGEVRKMLTNVFIDNAKLRKQVNSITRCALRIAARAEKEEADGSTPVRKTVLTKFLER
ncbi:unnamed protein product [Spirodela intermedia]|uniref:PX domain-containing protein n=1 Tax=Spirodela intermedia TaxID=51605 RepID=A0A7I8LC04_SPIIN|nr:unnamed protein product [Spirodela intermedia]